jgi:hypothetical protein
MAAVKNIKPAPPKTPVTPVKNKKTPPPATPPTYKKGGMKGKKGC